MIISKCDLMLTKRFWKLVILIVLVLLPGCDTTGIVLPYVAQVESVEPEIPGLEIRATAGGGGELEIINHTGQEVILLDEQDNPYARLAPDGVYELIEGTWQKTKDIPVYYCHDPRIVYEGPEPTAGGSQVVKQWRILGQVGDKTFTISGQTIYMDDSALGLPIAWVVGGAALGCLGMLIVSIIVFTVVWKKRETKSQTRNREESR